MDLKMLTVGSLFTNCYVVWCSKTKEAIVIDPGFDQESGATKVLRVVKESDLKVKFIAPILNRIDFRDVDKEIRDFYEEKMTYKTDKFILTGTPDFLISKGLEYSEKPYFFIQEFKRGKDSSHPESQLLAELIAGVELNHFKYGLNKV